MTKQETPLTYPARSDADKRALLSSLLRARADHGARAAIVPDPERRHEPFPLTDIQQAYWIGKTANLDLGGVSCQTYVEIELPHLDIERMNRAWRRLIERHEMLRAVFLPDGTQRILPQVEPFQIGVTDLRGWDAAAAAAQLEAVRERMIDEVRPADRWPLFEIFVHRLADKDRLHLSLDLLIVDFVSIQRLFDELFRVYLDPTVRLPELGLSFRDYVLAIEKSRESAGYRRAQAYWRGRLASLPPAPELPMRATTTATKPRFVRRGAILPKAAWQALAQRGSARGFTAAGVLLTAFGEVLATWSRHQRFTVNLTTSYRQPLHPQVHQIVGDFTSIVLLEVDCASAGTFAERGRRLQQRLWEGLEHQQYSGVQVVRDLARTSGPGANALMPVVFTSSLSHGSGGGDQRSRPIIGDQVYGTAQTPQVWLDHTVFEADGALHYNWDSVEELFHDGVLSDMFAAYSALLGRLAEDEQAWDGEAECLIPAAQLQMLREVNASEEARPEGMLLHTPFEERARRHPERIAVISAGREISYGELAARARVLGEQLRCLDVAPNRLVAVVMEKGWEQVVAVLGILRAGAAYLPIEADLPSQRIHHLLEHGQVAVVVTQPWLREKIAWPERIRTLAVHPEPPSADVVSLPALCQTASDLAYVIYTSGSTGLPKGVMIDHASALNTIADVNRRFEIGDGDRCLGVSSLSFDLSVYDVFGTLAAGGTLVLPSAALVRDPEHWLELLCAHRVTVWNSAPALMQMLVDYVVGAACEPPTSLRRVLMSGDWIPVTLPGRLAAIVPGVQTMSLGGATEASIWSIYYPIGGVDPAWTSIPYGRPLANQRFYVLNAEFEPCPVWGTGELFIAGDGLAKGYWRDPEQTSARFIQHPRTGERLYRTGDLGRYLPSGDIEFLGRQDSQVKILGYRVELGEIEAVLARHESVAEVAVVAIGKARENRHLAAFVVREVGQIVGIPELRAFLRQCLPEYMVPSALSFLDAMPLSSNGKVDRKKLEILGAQSERLREVPRVEPRTPVERTLVSLWMEVLGLEEVGIQDDFFMLGGDSIRGLQIVMRARPLGLEMSLRQVFQNRTIMELASQFESAAGDESSGPDIAFVGNYFVPLQVGGERATLFCVHPSDGQIECYLELIRRLGSEVSAYAFRSTHPVEENPSIQQLAAKYAAALEKTQPDGDIHLLGFSVGGVIAFEMACQLKARGRSVALLAVLDVGVDDVKHCPEDPLEAIMHYSERLKRRLAEAGDLPVEEEARAQTLLEAAVGMGLAPQGVHVDHLKPYLDRSRYHMAAMRAYNPPIYDGRGGRFLVMPGQRFVRAEDRTLGWKALVRGPVEVEYIAAEHFDLLRAPAVAEVAAALAARLGLGEESPEARRLPPEPECLERSAE